jgi:hypothetical protein
VEGFSRDPSHDDGVLATGEEQARILELGGGLAEDKDRLGFDLVEVGELVVGRRESRWVGSSVSR